MVATAIKNIKTAKYLFALSCAVVAFYIIVYFVIDDVYRYAVVGAVFELLWLPMLLCLVAIPIFSSLVIFKNKGKARVYASLAILLTIISIIILTRG